MSLFLQNTCTKVAENITHLTTITWDKFSLVRKLLLTHRCFWSFWPILILASKSIFCQHWPPVHTESFDWFLSGLEWILSFEFCLLKLLIFYQKLLWNIRSRLNSSTFWVFEPVFTYVWSKSSFFVQKVSILEELSLDLIFHNNFW